MIPAVHPSSHTPTNAQTPSIQPPPRPLALLAPPAPNKGAAKDNLFLAPRQLPPTHASSTRATPTPTAHHHFRPYSLSSSAVAGKSLWAGRKTQPRRRLACTRHLPNMAPTRLACTAGLYVTGTAAAAARKTQKHHPTCRQRRDQQVAWMCSSGTRLAELHASFLACVA